jgi:hypothetical protein
MIQNIYKNPKKLHVYKHLCFKIIQGMQKQEISKILTLSIKNPMCMNVDC